MTEELNMALVLMAIGMITVFVVLAMVSVVGNVIIIFVNKYAGGKAVISADPSISPSKIAAITSAVEVFTKGNGKIDRIEKIE